MFTGLPCSGKSTLAKKLSKEIEAEILDSDNIREFTTQDFSKASRELNMLYIAYNAYRLSKYNNVIIALINPFIDIRNKIKSMYPNIIEIYVKCNLDECKKRDVKGIYKKAKEGKIKNFTGINADYEEPINSIIVDTQKMSIKECIEKIMIK